MGGLGGRSVSMLAPSALLALAAAKLSLQNAILAGSVHGNAVIGMKKHWTSPLNNAIQAETSRHIQKACDMLIAAAVMQRLLDKDTNTSTDMATLKAVGAPHSSDSTLHPLRPSV